MQYLTYLLIKNKIMKRLFEISSEEKQRILEMHESATKKNYLSEQAAQPTQQAQRGLSTSGLKIGDRTYLLTSIIRDNDSLANFRSWPYGVTNTLAMLPNLKSIGLNGINKPGRSENNVKNMESHAISLIGDYLDAIAQKTNDKNAICNASPALINSEIIKKAEEEFNFNRPGVTPTEIYNYFKMDVSKFAQSVIKAAQQQAKSLGVCSA
jgi:hypothetical protein